jgi:hypothetical protein
MDLGDRGRGDGLLVDLEEDLLERPPEVLFDRAPDLRERERRHLVLERGQRLDESRREDVRPGADDLADLDEGRAEPLEEKGEGRAQAAAKASPSDPERGQRGQRDREPEDDLAEPNDQPDEPEGSIGRAAGEIDLPSLDLHRLLGGGWLSDSRAGPSKMRISWNDFAGGATFVTP